jgi:hypothetical protein
MQALTPADLAARRDRAAQMRQVGLTSPYVETRGGVDPLTDPVTYFEEVDAAVEAAEAAELLELANAPEQKVDLLAESVAWLPPRRH